MEAVDDGLQRFAEIGEGREESAKGFPSGCEQFVGQILEAPRGDVGEHTPDVAVGIDGIRFAAGSRQRGRQQLAALVPECLGEVAHQRFGIAEDLAIEALQDVAPADQVGVVDVSGVDDFQTPGHLGP